MTSATGTTDAPTTGGAPVSADRAGLHWWVEALIIVGFYLLYSYVRNRFGAGPESHDIAFEHARGVIDVEKALGLWIEPSLQRWYLGLPGHGWVRGWNIFYGTAHFFVTAGVLIAAFVFAPHRYRLVRTMLAATTALALLGFATFTLMPPRLLDVPGEYGACRGRAAGCNGYGIVDTIDRFGGIWKFSQGEAALISNQYAAMPSLHFGWSTWCAITVVLIIGKGRWRWLAFLYPAATLFCILVTGNHYWIDAFFGAVVLAGGWLVALGAQRWHNRRQSSRGPSLAATSAASSSRPIDTQ